MTSFEEDEAYIRRTVNDGYIQPILRLLKMLKNMNKRLEFLEDRLEFRDRA